MASKLSITKVLKAMSAAYDSDNIIYCYHQQGKPVGDGLAEFIYHEFRDMMNNGKGKLVLTKNSLIAFDDALAVAERELDSVRQCVTKLIREYDDEAK